MHMIGVYTELRFVKWLSIIFRVLLPQYKVACVERSITGPLGPLFRFAWLVWRLFPFYTSTSQILRTCTRK